MTRNQLQLTRASAVTRIWSGTGMHNNDDNIAIGKDVGDDELNFELRLIIILTMCVIKI